MKLSTPKLTDPMDLSTTTTYHAGIIQATANRILQQFSENVLGPYGISKMQWLIIGTVLDHRSTGVRITDLAQLLDTNKPYMTNTVNLLESKHILKRMENSVDSRSRLITVDPRFVPQCKKIEAALRDALRASIYSQVDPKEFRIYMKVLSKLAEINLDT